VKIQGVDGKASATRVPVVGCKEPTNAASRPLNFTPRRVALLSAWDRVARRSKITADILPPSRPCPRPKSTANATFPQYFNRLLGSGQGARPVICRCK